MTTGVRLSVICAVLLGLGTAAWAQDLSAPLAERFSRAVTALKAGRLSEAERDFRAVLAAGGGRAYVHHNLGIVLQQRGKHADALEQFRLAARQDPNFGPAWLLAGASLIALDRPAEAVVALERAVAILPRELAAHLQLADACERVGDFPRLVEQYRVITTLAPGDQEYSYRLGKAYLRLSQWSFERIRAIHPDAARLSQALGYEYLRQSRPDLALVAFETAAGRDPSLPEVHLALARIHAESGRWDQAAREIDRELAILPESRPAREMKARIDAARAKRGRP